MRNLTAIVLVLISLNASVFASSKEKDEGPEPPQSSGEIAWHVGIGVASAAAGGVAAAGGNIPGAVVGVANGAKNFIDAAKKYNENVQYKNDREEKEDEDDSYSWDYE